MVAMRLKFKIREKMDDVLSGSLEKLAPEDKEDEYGSRGS